MKITVTNHDKTTEAAVTHRKGGIRVDQFRLMPGETREFEIAETNEAFSFARGVVSGAALPGKSPTQLAAPDVATIKATVAAAKPAEPTWPQIRDQAIKLGAPKTVNKADALKLIAEHAAKAA